MKLAPLLCLILSCSSIPMAPEEIALEKFQEAEGLMRSESYKEAIPLYAYAIKVRERMKGAYHGMAYCWEKMGFESRAVEVLENLIKIDPQDERGLRELGRLYKHRGLLDEAIRTYKALAVRYPDEQNEVARLEALKR